MVEVSQDDGSGSASHDVVRYESLFREHPHAVFLLDRSGRFVEVNWRAGEISGRTTTDLLTMSFADLVRRADLDRCAEAFDLVLQREPQRLELTLLRPSDEQVDVHITGVPWVLDEEVVGMFGIAEDVTERNRLVRELEVTRALAERASEAKSEFVAQMSHEVRTPLTSILAIIELLDMTDPSPEQLELIATLSRSGARLMRLVDNVLDFAAVGTAVEKNLTEEFDLHALIRDAVALVEKPARLKGLEVRLDLGDDVPRRVRDHPTWTSQVLGNLLDNAVQNTDAGRVALDVGTVTSASSGPMVVYRVSDTGSGIDPAHHDLVFEPFSRIPGRGAVGGRRPGLGLSIVKQLVTISGGSVVMDSEVGRGTTFTISMPARLADHDPGSSADGA